MSTGNKNHRSGQSPSTRKNAADKPLPDGNRDVGQALRSIYQKTVDEAIPSEMLDLLGKLG